MTERTVEEMCRDLLNKVPCKTPTSSMDLAPMANELSKILERTQTSKSIEKRLDAQLDLTALRRDAERWRKLKNHGYQQDGYRLLVTTVFRTTDEHDRPFEITDLDAAVDALP